MKHPQPEDCAWRVLRAPLKFPSTWPYTAVNKVRRIMSYSQVLVVQEQVFARDRLARARALAALIRDIRRRRSISAYTEELQRRWFSQLNESTMQVLT